MKFIRQGDVGLIRIDNLPNEIFEKDKVLALGEVTGHSHRFENNQVQVFADSQGQQFVDVKKKSKLIHEEHKHLDIPKGVYKVVIQREYDILSDNIRQVLD